MQRAENCAKLRPNAGEVVGAVVDGLVEEYFAIADLDVETALR